MDNEPVSTQALKMIFAERQPGYLEEVCAGQSDMSRKVEVLLFAFYTWA